MNQKNGHFKFQRMALPLRPLFGRLDRDHDIAQHLRRGRKGVSLQHREGEDIRGTIDSTIPPIQSLHLGIVDEEEAELSLETSQGPQDLCD
jgi:hypothetical protein